MSDSEAKSDNCSPHLRDQLLTLDDLANLPPTKPLIDGLVYRNTLGQLSGGPGSYKSFLITTMSCCLAAKEPFGEFNVSEQATVVYVAAEGASDMNKRILAWCEVWEVNPDTLLDRLFVLPLPIQLGNEMNVKQAVEIVREVKADLLVLDTRARCTLGLNENSATEQGEAIEAADEIRRAVDCSVLGVHHAPRNGGAGRGSNAWDGAIWSDLRVEGGGLQAKIHCQKHKEVPSGCDHLFTLRPHTVSEKLMPQTLLATERQTLVISKTAPGIQNLSTPSRRAVVEIIWNSAPPEGFTGPQVLELAAEAGIKKSSTYQALKWGVDQGYIRNIGSSSRSRYVRGDREP